MPILFLTCNEDNPVAPDTTAPTVTITYPADNSSLSAQITISVNVIDNSDIASAVFIINGSEALLYIKGKYSMNLDYVYEIAFKDGRYKFDLISLKYEETDYKNFPNFKTDKKIIKNFGDSPQIIEDFFNNLNNSIKEYITVDSNNDDW